MNVFFDCQVYVDINTEMNKQIDPKKKNGLFFGLKDTTVNTQIEGLKNR